MLKIRILAAFIVLIINEGNCQNRDHDEKTEIHKIIIKTLKNEGEKFDIFPTTKKSAFYNFDFADGGRGLDTLSNRISNKKEWVDFIKSIDTASITAYKLNLNSSSRKKNKLLTFAPIIYSKKNDKALCISKKYNMLRQTGQVTAWYFEREKSIWLLKDMQIFSLIN